MGPEQGWQIRAVGHTRVFKPLGSEGFVELNSGSPEVKGG